MKVAFLSINHGQCPHFECELELMSNHIDAGDQVYVLTCEGVLGVCPSNSDQKFVKCLLCRERFNAGIKCLDTSKIKVIKLNKKRYLDKLPLLPNKFNNVDALKCFEIDDVDFGAAVACSFISELRDHGFDTLLHKEIINKTLNNSVLIYENTIDFLKNIKPDVFYLYNGRFAFERPAVRACQKLNIPFIAYDTGMGHYALCKNGIVQDLKELKKEISTLWEDPTDDESKKREIGERWFIEARKGRGFYGMAQKNGLLPDSFDFSKKNIAIFNSSLDELETFPEWKGDLYNNENEGILRLVRSFEDKRDFKFYLRIHPNLKNLNNSQIRSLKKLAELGCSNLEIIWPEDLVDSYALLDACEKVIIFSSTIGVEACFAGKPTILLGKALYEDLDCCYIPKSHQEAVDMILSNLTPKNNKNVLKYGYWVLKRCITFNKFDKDNRTFLGSRLDLKNNLKNRMLLAFYSRLDRFNHFKNKILRRENLKNA